MAKKLKVTLIRSLIGCTERQKATVRSLGLRKRHQVRILDDTPVYRGMIAKVPHLLKVEVIENE